MNLVPPTQDTLLLETALAYGRKGRPVFPVKPNKQPLTKHGFKEASTDEEQIHAWWTRWPRAGIAVPTGPDWFVLDVDDEHALAALTADHGPLPPTVEAVTPRPGRHFYLHGRVTNSRGALPDGIDVRGLGGYVLIPPSPHENGCYEWRTTLDEVPIAPAPKWLLGLLTARKHQNGHAPVIEGEIPRLQRNVVLASMAGTMRRRGFHEPAIAAALLVVNRDRCNPPLAEPSSAPWPVAATLAGGRHEAVRAAGNLVLQAMSDGQRTESAQAASGTAKAPVTGGADPGGADPGGADPGSADACGAGSADADSADADSAGTGHPAVVPAGRYASLMAGWVADADLLLAERAQRRNDTAVQVRLPRRIPVSSLVTMARDPDELAQQVRRPMPRPPAPRALRGTAFHQWLEERFGQQRLIDPDDLLGAADDAGPADADADLTELKERFDAGEWANRWPYEVEVPFETLIGDQLVRGRIDAVFADSPDGGFDVVDWKTGRRPRTPDEEQAVAVQLAAYRLAWAALAGVPVADVRAAFYYVGDDVTVRPADLLDEAALAAMIDSIPLAP